MLVIFVLCTTARLPSVIFVLCTTARLPSVIFVLCTTARLPSIIFVLCTTARLPSVFAEPGLLQFQKPSYLYKESAGIAELVIERNEGCDGHITVKFKTKDITAIAGKDYEVSLV